MACVTNRMKRFADKSNLVEGVPIRHLTGKRAAASARCNEGEILVLNKAQPEGLPCEVFDPLRLRVTGAVALTLTPDGLQVKTTRDHAGRRLWNDEDRRAERRWWGHGTAR